MNWIVLPLLLSWQASARWATPHDVGSVLENYVLQVTADQDGSSTTTIEQVWRLQTEEGKINGSVREIEYNAFTDKVEIVEAKTINGKESAPVLPSAIEDRDKGESRDYDAMKVKSLVFPQVQVGSTLVLKYKIRSAPPPVPDQWSLHFVFPIGMLVEHLVIDVKSVKPIASDVYDPDGILRVSTSKHEVHLRLRKEIPGQVVGEKDSFFHPARFATLLVSTEKDWGKHFAPLINEYEKTLAEATPASLAKEIKGWSKLKDPNVQLTKVLEYFSQKYRYFGDWRRVRGGFFPRHLAEIEKSRYGDCKDLATLLAATLRQLGYAAHVSLIDRGITPWFDKPEDPIANIGMFNHAIARAERDGHVWWLDPTNTVVSLSPYADIASKPAFVLISGKSGFERLPKVEADQYRYTDTETYHFGPSGDVRVDVQADYLGMGAYRLSYGFLTSPEEKILFDIVDYFSEGQDLKDFKFNKFVKAGVPDRALRDLHFDFVYWTPSVTYTSPVGQFLPLHDGGLSGAFYETSGRESDLQLTDIPLSHHSKKILKNVQGLGKPTVCELKSPWLDIRREVVYTPSDIIIEQNTVVRVPVILKKEYSSAAFQLLRKQARECFYRNGLVFKAI